MPPVYSTSRWKAKLQSLELSDLSCSRCNLVVHIPTKQMNTYSGIHLSSSLDAVYTACPSVVLSSDCVKYSAEAEPSS
jgi:hypothetical protein